MAAPRPGDSLRAWHTTGIPGKTADEAPEEKPKRAGRLDGVDDGIRTHNNRNHKAMEGILEAAGINEIKHLKLVRRRKIG